MRDHSRALDQGYGMHCLMISRCHYLLLFSKVASKLSFLMNILVQNDVLNWLRLVISWDNEFHVFGAETVNARWPSILKLHFWTCNTTARCDRSWYLVLLRWKIISSVYAGDWPDSALKVNTSIMYRIRYRTGSQWSSFKTCCMWACLVILQTKCAAKFCKRLLQ